MKQTEIDWTTWEGTQLDGEFDDWPDVYTEKDIEKEERKNADSDTEIRGD